MPKKSRQMKPVKAPRAKGMGIPTVAGLVRQRTKVAKQNYSRAAPTSTPFHLGRYAKRGVRKVQI